MITSAGRIDFGRASEFGEVADQGGVEQAALGKIRNQRAVTPVVHRRDDVFHALDGGERLGAVNIPGNFVENGNERVDGDEADASLDQTPRQQAALAEAGQTVAFADLLRFL